MPSILFSTLWKGKRRKEGRKGKEPQEEHLSEDLRASQ